jgi:hypothetical protein
VYPSSISAASFDCLLLRHPASSNSAIHAISSANAADVKVSVACERGVSALIAFDAACRSDSAARTRSIDAERTAGEDDGGGDAALAVPLPDADALARRSSVRASASSALASFKASCASTTRSAACVVLSRGCPRSAPSVVTSPTVAVRSSTSFP